MQAGDGERIRNSSVLAALPLLVTVLVFVALMDPFFWAVLVPSVTWTFATMPVQLKIEGDDLVVTYLTRRRRISLKDVKTVRVQRFSGRARVAHRRGGLWGCIVWSPLRIDAFTHALAERGVDVKRGVQLLGDWWG